MDAVGEDLFVGASEAAGDATLLNEHGVGAVVSLTHGSPEDGYPPGVAVTNAPMKDGPRNERGAFEAAVEATRAHLDAGERVLVHCSAGASRSVAVAATVLALRRDWAVERALSAVAERRAEADPHPALRRRADSVRDGLG